MSNLYDALQAAHEEQLAKTNEPNKKSATSSPPPATDHNPLPTPTFHEEAELLSLPQTIATRLPNPDQNVIQFIGSRKGEGASTLIREFALTVVRHSDKPVLLVEADFIQPSQSHAFGIEAKPPIDYVLKEGKHLAQPLRLRSGQACDGGLSTDSLLLLRMTI